MTSDQERAELLIDNEGDTFDAFQKGVHGDNEGISIRYGRNFLLVKHLQPTHEEKGKQGRRTEHRKKQLVQQWVND